MFTINDLKTGMLVKLRYRDDLWLVLTNTCYDENCGDDKCLVNLNKDYCWMPLNCYSKDLLYYNKSGRRDEDYDIMEVYSAYHVNYSVACKTINKDSDVDNFRTLIYSRAETEAEIKKKIKDLEDEILTLKSQL